VPGREPVGCCEYERENTVIKREEGTHEGGREDFLKCVDTVVQ